MSSWRALLPRFLLLGLAGCEDRCSLQMSALATCGGTEVGKFFSGFPNEVTVHHKQIDFRDGE
jgi:hypothetical protein